jgi:hypothetical protein
MSVEKILYKLACQHYALAPAFYVSGKLYCPLCREEQFIHDVEVMEWRANCRQCKYSRWAGMSEETAEVFANGHVSHNPGHAVSVGRVQHLAAIKTRKKMDAWRILAKP